MCLKQTKDLFNTNSTTGGSHLMANFSVYFALKKNVQQLTPYVT